MKEEELRWKEFKRAVSKMKDEKAMEGDGIENEVWKYGGKKMEERERGIMGDM